MAACDQISGYIWRVVGVSGGPGIPIVFPTALIAKTQGPNTSVSCGAGSDTTVLAANANRKLAQIVNISGSTLFVAHGAPATTSSMPLPNNGTWTDEPDTIGEINQQAIHVFNPTGGALSVQVYEE